MKRYGVAVIAVWIVSVVLLLIVYPKPDNSNILELNRLYVELSRQVIDGQGIPPLEQTDAFARATQTPRKQNPLLLVILISLTPLTVLFALAKTQTSIIKPLRAISDIPGQLAKGHFQVTAPQIKSKAFHPFLWGLDMLRVVLEEQKSINLKLEKERKTLVASLSHDIKTPLSSIRTYSLAVKDGVYESPDEVQNALNVIIGKTMQIERLADELLISSVNAIEEIAVEASGYYLSELRSAVDKTVRSRIGLLKMDYTLEALEKDCLLSADMDRFAEVCDNIVENAVKYGDMGRLSVCFGSEENFTLISIENTGNRIPEAELKHIFTSFYRGSNAVSA